MHGRRRYRPVHQRTPWLVRAGCAGAIVGVVALGARHPAPAVDVKSLTAAQDRRVCALAESFIDVALIGVSPPADPTPADMDAALRINAALAQMGETLRQSVREMGC